MANSGKLKVRGLVPDMPLIFEVNEFHFTAPSEHTLNNKVYDLEMQIVHSINLEYIPGEEKLRQRKLIVSILFEAKAGANNAFINSLNMPSLDFISSLEVNTFLVSLPNRYAFYEGSLSRPPCTENIYHFVYLDPQPISMQQLNYFTLYYSGNSRMVQSLNNRPVVKVTKVIISGAPMNYHVFFSITIMLIFLLFV